MKYPSYPEYKDSGVQWLGQVPKHWEVKQLKHISQVRQGVTKGRDLTGKNVVELPYLRVANVQDGYLDLNEISTISILDSEMERYLLQSGDVLMNEGGDNDKLGRGAVWNEEVKPCLHQNHVFCVRPSTSDMEVSTWISMWTQTSAAKSYFLLRGKQTTNLASISSTSIRELPLPFPPRSEQTAIAEFLNSETGRIDTLVAKKQRLIALLKEKRTALISRTVTRGLPEAAARRIGLEPNTRFKKSNIEWLEEVPEHWKVKRLSFIALLKSGDNITSEQMSEDGEYPVYGGNGVRGSYSRYTHDGFFVLIGRQGALCGNINYADGKFWASEHAIVVNPLGQFSTKWLGELLLAMNLGQYSVSAAQPGLSVSQIGSLRIPVPPPSPSKLPSPFTSTAKRPRSTDWWRKSKPPSPVCRSTASL